MKAWHFVAKTLRDGSPIPADGIWLEHSGPLELCVSGLHASKDPFDALAYAPGPILCRVEVGGKIIEDGDRVVATRRRIIKRIDMTAQLRQFARECALEVIHLWDAPPVVRRYLETGDEAICGEAADAAWAAWAARADVAAVAAWAARAAVEAAWAARADVAAVAAWWAARAAAVAAADAARAARDAAAALAWGTAQRKRFNQMVREAFKQ